MSSPPLTPELLTVLSLEIALFLAGLVAIWRFHLGPRAADFREPRLTHWELGWPDFLMGALAVIVGGVSLQILAVLLQRHAVLPLSENNWLIFQGAAFQLGLLGGALGATALWRAKALVETKSRETSPAPVYHPVLAGMVTFLAAMPVVSAIAYLWQKLLGLFGYDAQLQELVDVFKAADATGASVMALLAVVIAPLTEELIFRAGVFRYLRTRLPRIPALLIPAVFFAALHGNVAAFAPLVALGIIFAVAYERTGRVAVPMIAHGLFNLHTLLLLVAGVES